MSGDEKQRKRSFSGDNLAIDQALQKCAQELKALAMIYQSHNRKRWAEDAYEAFLNLAQPKSQKQQPITQDITIEESSQDSR